MTRPTGMKATDWALLFTLVPVWLVCFGMHVEMVSRQGLVQPSFFVATGDGPNAPPVVAGYFPELQRSEEALRIGDRILRIGGTDLGGASHVTVFSTSVYHVFGVLAFLLLGYWAISFPPGLDPARRAPRWIPVVFALGFAVPRLNLFFGGPLPPSGFVGQGLAADGLGGLALVAVLGWSYHCADPIGRRRMRWVLYGIFVGVIPPEPVARRRAWPRVTRRLRRRAHPGGVGRPRSASPRAAARRHRSIAPVRCSRCACVQELRRAVRPLPRPAARRPGAPSRRRARGVEGR